MAKYSSAVKPNPPVNPATQGNLPYKQNLQIDPSTTPVNSYIVQQGAK